MKILNIISNLRALGESPDLVKRFNLDNPPDWMFTKDGTGNATGISALLNVPGVARPAENLVMVYGCLRCRTEAIGGIPLRLTDADDNIIESGKAWELLQNPNARQAWRQYVRQLETYNALYDCIVILKVGEPGRPPDELIPLSPGYLKPVMGIHQPSGTPAAVAYEYNDPITGSMRIFQPEELIIHKGFNPDAPLAPLSPINVLRRTMQGDLAAREQNLALFLNDATPKGVLQTDKSMTKEQADEALQKWNDKNSGYLRRHKTSVLWGGLKYESIGLSPQEMEFLNGLKFLRTDYYIVFRVKAAMLGEMLGETGLSQGSSTDSQKVEWWEDVGLAELDLIAGMHQELIDSEFKNADKPARTRSLSRNEMLAHGRFVKRSLARANPPVTKRNLYLWFDDNAIPALVRSRLGKLDQMVKIMSQGWKPDDVNDYLDLGLPPHPDNLGRVGFSFATIGDEAPEKPAPAAPQETPTTENTDEDVTPLNNQPEATPTERAFDNLVRAFERVEHAKAEKFKGLKQAFDKFCAPREKAAAKKFSRFFLEQRDRVMSRINEISKRSDDKTAKLSRADNKDILNQIFPIEEENTQLFARLTPLWTTHMQDGWGFFNQEAGVDEKTNPFEIDDPKIQEAIKARQIQGAEINNTTEGKLKDIISKAFDEGETTAGLSDRIAEWYSENCIGETSARPATAAQTQTSGIVNDGRALAAKEVGGLKKGWLHGGSKEPREAHVAAQDKYMSNPIGLDEKFVVNGFECDHPGSTELPVGESANCTCMTIYVKG